MKKYFFSGFIVLLQFLIPLIAFSQQTLTVTDCNLNGWVKQLQAGTSLTFKNAPPVPILGKGSLEFASPNTSFARLRNTSYHNTLLSSLTEFGYSTYVQNREDNYDACFVVLQIDKDGNGTADDRLVFDPLFQSGNYVVGVFPDQGPTLVGVWQTWDMLHGAWWLGPSPNPLNGGALFSLANYIAINPNVKIVNDESADGGGLRLQAGAPGFFAPNFIGNADNFRIGINGLTTIYDFEFTTADAGPDKTVVYGYGSNCTTLSGAAAGGMPQYSYSWSPGGSTSNNISTEVCPTATTTYTLTITDANGCSRTDNVTVFVNDVRCGNNLNKLLVCHNDIELCISSSDVQNHLSHGDYLGACSSTATKGIGEKQSEIFLSGQFKLSNYPNPFFGSTTIQYELPFDCNVSINIYDFTGQLLSRLVSENKKSGLYHIDFNSKNLSAGVYYCQMTTVSGKKIFTKTIKLIITR